MTPYQLRLKDSVRNAKEIRRDINDTQKRIVSLACQGDIALAFALSHSVKLMRDELRLCETQVNFAETQMVVLSLSGSTL